MARERITRHSHFGSSRATNPLSYPHHTLVWADARCTRLTAGAPSIFKKYQKCLSFIFFIKKIGVQCFLFRALPITLPKAQPKPLVLTMICKCLPQIPSLNYTNSSQYYLFQTKHNSTTYTLQKLISFSGAH